MSSSNVSARQSTYVVYPAALFDGWEVVKDGADDALVFGTSQEAIHYATTYARTDEASVRLEDWFGHTVAVWSYEPVRPAA
ncbi:MAG: DUF2188 domain-containing protein [Burkholderiales bacterium]